MHHKIYCVIKNANFCFLFFIIVCKNVMIMLFIFKFKIIYIVSYHLKQNYKSYYSWLAVSILNFESRFHFFLKKIHWGYVTGFIEMF